MKKVLFILMAVLMVLGATQCKKQPEKYGPFVLNAILPGGDGKTTISPMGEVAWKANDKIYAVYADNTSGHDAGELAAELYWAGGNKFASDLTVENGTYHFFYLGTEENGLDIDWDAKTAVRSFAEQNGTLEDVAKRCHLMVAKNVMVTGGQATATMENKVSIAYFDISGFNCNTVHVYGSKLYRFMNIDLATGEFSARTEPYEGAAALASCFGTDITIPAGKVYVAFIPTDKTTIIFEGHNEDDTYDLIKQLVVNESTYTMLEAGRFYTNYSTPTDNGPIEVFPYRYFSVAADKKVIFSPGNLQYRPSTQEWRFAPHQWDCIGYGNQYISENYDQWIDLFNYGTDLNPTYTGVWNWNYDWIWNEIEGWRTPRYTEWEYVLRTRTDAASKRGLATLDDNVGVVILPDNWILPEGCAFTAGSGDGWNTNNYDSSHWQKMEAEGAIFLPAAGYREGTTMHGFGAEDKEGRYWAPSIMEDVNYGRYVYYYSFDDYLSIYMEKEYLEKADEPRNRGYSVRMVQDID